MLAQGCVALLVGILWLGSHLCARQGAEGAHVEAERMVRKEAGSLNRKRTLAACSSGR